MLAMLLACAAITVLAWNYMDDKFSFLSLYFFPLALSAAFLHRQVLKRNASHTSEQERKFDVMIDTMMSFVSALFLNLLIILIALSAHLKDDVSPLPWWTCLLALPTVIVFIMLAVKIRNTKRNEMQNK
jgi:membrane protein implicated in regulation of membrane protease activity